MKKLKFKITTRSIEEQMGEMASIRGAMIIKILKVKKQEFSGFEKMVDSYSIFVSKKMNIKIKLFQIWVLRTLAKAGDDQAKKMLCDLCLDKNEDPIYGLIFQDKGDEIRMGVFRTLSKMEGILF